MKTIRNKTHSAVRVPLPHGKVLHLGPLKSGQIGAGAESHPPLKKLLDGGDVELVGEGERPEVGHPGSGAAHESTHGHAHATTAFKTGDR
jgi:hypothetical protein